MLLNTKDISQVIYHTTMDRINRNTLNHNQTGNLSPIVSYLLYLSPSYFLYKDITFKILIQRREHNEIRRYLSFTINNIERICPITDHWEEMMVGSLINYRYDEVKSVKYKGALTSHLSAIHDVCIESFKKLNAEMPLANRYLRSLMDLRILNCVMNKVDYGFVKANLCSFHTRFEHNFLYKKQVEEYLLNDMLSERRLVD